MSSFHNNVPRPAQDYIDRGYGNNQIADQQASNNIVPDPSSSTSAYPSHLSHTAPAASNDRGRFNEEWDASQRGSSIVETPMHRSSSVMSQGETLLPSRGGTLKKKSSMKRTGSLRRSGSRRSSRAGSVKSLALHPGAIEDEENSAFVTPVPLSGSPTEVLANRFQRECNCAALHNITDKLQNGARSSKILLHTSAKPQISSSTERNHCSNFPI